MKESYERPLDRPATIWCRACLNKINLIAPKCSEWPPKNLRTWTHNYYKCPAGSMVWRYSEDVVVAKEPPKPAVALCGSAACDGTCDNLLCTGVPIKNPIQPVVHRYTRRTLLISAAVSFLAGVLLSQLANYYW